MRIEGINPQQLQKIYSQQRQLIDREETEQSRASGDSMEISEEARQIHNIAAEMEEIPDIREERVQELHQQVQSGNYEVEAEEVAESMLEQIEMQRGE